MARPILNACLAFLLSGLVACDQPAPPADHLVVGAPIPDIVLTTLDGNSVHLRDYRGKLVVLNFWATWCEPCRREMPNLQQLSASLDLQRFAVVGVAVDEETHLVREYLLDKGVTFPNYIDRNQAVARDQVGVPLFPYTLLISAEGNLIQRYAGPREWQRSEVIELLQSVYEGNYSVLK